MLKTIEVQCGICESTIKRVPSTIKKNNFCSKECNSEFQKTLLGPKSARWKGGITKMNGGYLFKLIGNNKYKAIQRIVMEEHLGRELTSDEIVHHINEIKTDNRIKNLQIVTRAEHSRMHKPRLGTGKNISVTTPLK